MRCPRIVLAVCALAALPASPLYAWYDAGHMVAAKLAYDELTDAQKAVAAGLLKAHPHYEEFLSAQKADGVAADEWAFLRAATWPDWVRNPQHHHTEFNFPKDHYINLPFVRPGDEESFKEEDLTPSSPNVLTALKEFTAVMKGDAPDDKKAVALCWLLHLIGDIHQPLHAATLYSSEFPHGDEGGNLMWVTGGDGRRVHLHAFWDALLGDDPHYDKVEELAKSLETDPKYSRMKFKEALGRAEFSDWADEGLNLAKEKVYLNGKLNWAKGKDDPGSAPKLPDGYEDAAKSVARSQIALAGHRLADALGKDLARP